MKKSSKGFTLMELVVVIAAIAILAAIAIPQFIRIIDEAKQAATLASTRVTVSTVEGCMALYDQEDWYAPRSSGASYAYSEGSMNNYLEQLFESGVETENDYSYVNQYSGSETILNWTSSISGDGANPAVFLTNTSKYSYENSTTSNMSLLKGTIIVYFATEGTGDAMTTTQIEVYYTDGDGVKCDEPFILTM